MDKELKNQKDCRTDYEDGMSITYVNRETSKIVHRMFQSVKNVNQ